LTTTAPDQQVAERRQGSRPAGLVRTARPRQWIKNVLVLAAPAAAGVLGQVGALLDVVIAFGAFCLAASGTYFVNDARDARADREHPRKRDRPVAAGVVSPRLAYTVGAACLAAGIALSFATGRWPLAVVLAAYVALTTSYSLWLKHVPILDLIGVSGGFVLRAVAGAAAVGVGASSWFLTVATLGSLFVVASKREAELRSSNRLANRGSDHGADRVAPRPALQFYTREFLWYVRATTSGAVLVSYCLWAFELHTGLSQVAFGLSILPFSVGILRYAMLVDSGFGEEPEEVFLSDPMLLCAGVLLAGCLAVGVYAF
jgi:decaprenyl-phosphate phosphoribosyltransferase